MRSKWFIGAAALAVACSGKEAEEGDICTELQVSVTVVSAAGEPLSTASVEMDGVECPGDGTSNVYSCTAIYDPLGSYQLTILEPNSNAFSQFITLPPPEEWCDGGPFPFDAQLGVMMGA